MSAHSVIDTRKVLLQSLESASVDLIIIGGGIHGCAAAREAALQGLSVMLFEADDIASGTSSRSSKMLHGGIRYLEQGDLSLVFEALRERAVLLKIAAPFARSQQFLFPIIPHQTKPGWQVRTGLMLYDLLARLGHRDNPLKGHHAIAASEPESTQLREMGLSFTHLFSYRDAQMDDARICLEMALDARDLGVNILNHTAVTGMRYIAADRKWLVQWKSRFPSLEGESLGSVILDLRGPELSLLDEKNGEVPGVLQSAAESMVLSRGSHLLFNVPWTLPGIALPTGIPGRYYFVWPYFTSYGEFALVGTTDLYRPLESHDPTASEEEIAELLGYLKRDLPRSGLNEKTLYQSYCGVRSLVRSRHARLDAHSFPKTSRTHRWVMGEKYVALVGGKYTSARNTAAQGIKGVLAQLGRAPTAAWSESMNRLLPGARGWSYAQAEKLTKELSQRFSVTEAEASVTVKRRGMSAQKLVVQSSSQRNLLQSEVSLAVQEEFAVTVEDIMRRRLNTALIPGAGMEMLLAVSEALIAEGRSTMEVEDEVRQYRARWKPIS